MMIANELPENNAVGKRKEMRYRNCRKGKEILRTEIVKNKGLMSKINIEDMNADCESNGNDCGNQYMSYLQTIYVYLHNRARSSNIDIEISDDGAIECTKSGFAIG